MRSEEQEGRCDELFAGFLVNVVVPSEGATTAAVELGLNVQAFVPVGLLVVAGRETLGAEGVELLDVCLRLEGLLSESLLDGLRRSGRGGGDDGGRVVEKLG